MAIAGLDIATRTGVAVLSSSDERLLYAGDIVCTNPEHSGQVFRHLRKSLYELIGNLDITQVAVETPLRTDIEIPTGGKGIPRPGKGSRVKNGEIEEMTRPPMATFQRIYGLCAVAEEVCAARNVPFVYVHQGTWRKAFNGTGHATKEQTFALACQVYPQLKTKSLDSAEALGVAWWLRGHLNPRMAGVTDDLFVQQRFKTSA